MLINKPYQKGDIVSDAKLTSDTLNYYTFCKSKTTMELTIEKTNGCTN